MNTSNYPYSEGENTMQDPPRKNSKNAIIAILGACILGLGAYVVIDKNNTGETIHQQESQIVKVSDEKSSIQKSFDESLSRLDSMATVNTDLNKELTVKQKDIAKAKSEIRSILNKKNATAGELSRAKTLIASLNEKIASYEQDIAKLTQENETLNGEKVVLTQEKEQITQDLTAVTEVKLNLEKEVDVASTLNASNIVITPVNVKGNGKEKVSTTAKRVDKILVNFDVTNRIAAPGATDVYVIVVGPDGKPVSSGAETFTTREEGDKNYTAKLPVEIETAKKKNVEFSFAPGTDFQQGSYKIMIYQNGFLIGEGVKELKKGGLFS